MSMNPLNGLFRLYYRLAAETPYKINRLPKGLRNVRPRFAVEVNPPWYLRHFFLVATLDGLVVGVMGSVTWFGWTQPAKNASQSPKSTKEEKGDEKGDAGVLSSLKQTPWLPDGWELRPAFQRGAAITFQTAFGLMLFTILYAGKRTLIRRLTIFDVPTSGASQPTPVKSTINNNPYLKTRTPRAPTPANRGSGQLVFLQTAGNGPDDGYLIPASKC
ncbi:hypothetical protein PUNSTDRAFT_54144, partial [Punctularia strigosozonata HHB-11173 SS5]|uniref:uncharacterized protein n=1 Tax=Punctularia strigosozonata (strain HHB-11173) TaxID=741275 RepID=UPI000441741D